MAPRPTHCPSHCHWAKSVMAVLDVDAASVYRKYSIEPESPTRGDFVWNNELAQQKMKKKRILLYISTATLVGVGVGLFALVLMYRQLADERQHIESRYEQFLSRLEGYARDSFWGRPDHEEDLDDMWKRVDRERAMYGDIRASLSSPMVCSAGWSIDGHHGARGLYSHPSCTGRETFSWPVSHSENGLRTLRLGRSREGDELVVLEGFVPDGRKRFYTIAFFREEIRKDMKDHAKTESQPDAPADPDVHRDR